MAHVHARSGFDLSKANAGGGIGLGEASGSNVGVEGIQVVDVVLVVVGSIKWRVEL